MYLKRIKIQGFRTFYRPCIINFEEDITILTGQNDVGKSALLRAIEMYCRSLDMLEEDVNIDFQYPHSTPWNSNHEVKATMTFVLDENARDYFPDVTGVPPNSEADIEYLFANKRRNITGVRRGKTKTVKINSNKISKLPHVIVLPNQFQLTQKIDESDISPLEREFLKIGFGPNGIKQLKAQSDVFRSTTLASAQKKFNQELQKILPVDLGFKFIISLIPNIDDEINLSISLTDKHGGFTPIHIRGTGIQKVITLLASLMTLPQDRFVMILFDEPESSLHADAQHALRRLLELIATQPNIQIIYSTHSSSMINTFDPKGLRLLRRTSHDGTATTVVDEKPYRNNYLPVRIKLGMSPSDSLLYAPLTVIVEGSTEILCLPLLLKRLHDDEVEGFEDLEHLFALSHFLDGQGNNFEFWCKMAISQGAKTVIFVDGDKIRDINKTKFKQNFPDVPVIHLPDKIDFEDLVPNDKYFEALNLIVPENDLSMDDYQDWWKSKALSEKIMFSRRIDIWLKDQFDTSLDKPKVMRKAIEITELEDIQHIEILRQLVKKMRDIVATTS